MTVKELIVFLEKRPQDLPVVYRLHSEQILLTEALIEIEELCMPRNDGWVQDKRPDMPTQKYLVFPGN